MTNKALEFIQNIKNSALKNALLTHGLGDGSQLERFVRNAMTNPEILNSTETRMTMYTSEISPFLYPDNSFVTKSVNDAAFAASGNTKRLNDAVTGPAVTKGRVYSLALANGANAPTKTVKVRKNTGHDWAIEYFHTDPTVVTLEDLTELPYDKRSETLKAHADILNLYIANFTAVEWAQGAIGVAETVNHVTGNNQFVFTTGKDKDGNVLQRANSVAGATGNVNRISQYDFLTLKEKLVKQQLGSMSGTMYFLPTAEQFSDITDPRLFPNFIDYEKSGRESRLALGESGMIYGIVILNPRHREDWGANVIYSYSALAGDNTNLTKIEDTAASGANMVSAGIAWVDNLVLRAQGSAIVFPWQNSPIYMGDVYASELRYGAIKKRNDEKGVVMLVENPFGAIAG